MQTQNDPLAAYLAAVDALETARWAANEALSAFNTASDTLIRSLGGDYFDGDLIPTGGGRVLELVLGREDCWEVRLRPLKPRPAA